MNQTKRSSWVLLLVAAMFLLPFLLAAYLRFSGWQPGQTRNLGELLAPPLPLELVQARQADGRSWDFVNQDYRWTLLAWPGRDCAAPCQAALRVLPNVRESLGRHADRLPQFVLDPQYATTSLPLLELSGPLPPVLAQPAQGLAVWLVDPHGFLVMRYAADFDPADLRKDLSRLIK